jgi:hypothetical protein
MRNSFENPLPGVPAIESPFFDRIFAEGAFSEETLAIARDLRRDGYAVIDFPDPPRTWISRTGRCSTIPAAIPCRST